MEKYCFRSNVTKELKEVVTSAFKADKRIWSLDFVPDGDSFFIHVAAELSAAEVQAKIRSVGFNAELVEESSTTSQMHSIPTHFAESLPLPEQILFVLSLLKKATADEIAMEIMELKGGCIRRRCSQPYT